MRIFTVVAAVLAVLSFGYAAYFGVAWYAAANSSESSYAAHRDEALRSGQVGITNFLTLDYKKVDEDLQRWLNSSTGDLRAEIDKDKDSRKKQLVDAKTVTSSKVLDAAITELDDRAGKAKMIAVVESTVAPDGGQQVTKINRYLDRAHPHRGRLEAEPAGPAAGGHLSRPEADWTEHVPPSRRRPIPTTPAGGRPRVAGLNRRASAESAEPEDVAAGGEA